MYLKKEIKTNYAINSLDTASFKFFQEDQKLTALTNLEGKIDQIGIDYVNLLLDNNQVVTILTDKISKITWVDPKCERICKKCHHHTCRCVQFMRDHDDFDKDNHRHLSREEFCRRCRKKPCDCKKDDKFQNNQHKRKHSKFVDPKLYINKHEQILCEKCGPLHHHDNDCLPKFTCFCDFAIPFCDDRIELRLAGLDDGVNLELFRHRGCRVKLELAFE
ncbi:hypothetical protein ACFSCX_02495 [Bacillus salitolerans]|uniref:Uncharacterized protein n=1 Tax=Bacillus salitolerans TaxID=1437434 RepID=A0ABW4LJM8_9BACI